MKTRRVVVSLLAGALAVTVVGWGCNKQSATGGNAARAAGSAGDQAPSVGVVDYSKVLRDMSWASKLDTDLKSYHDELFKELKAFDQHYTQQITDLQKSIGKDATPAQQQQFSQTVIAARQTLAQLQQQANEKYGAYQGEWIRRYKDALAPIVRQVAQKGNYKVVLGLSDAIVFLDPAVDLTNGVVDATKAQTPTIVEVPQGHLEGPNTVGPNMSVPTTGPSTKPAAATQP